MRLQESLDLFSRVLHLSSCSSTSLVTYPFSSSTTETTSIFFSDAVSCVDCFIPTGYTLLNVESWTNIVSPRMTFGWVEAECCRQRQIWRMRIPLNPEMKRKKSLVEAFFMNCELIDFRHFSLFFRIDDTLHSHFQSTRWADEQLLLIQQKVIKSRRSSDEEIHDESNEKCLNLKIGHIQQKKWVE